jgi:hypothetical protein
MDRWCACLILTIIALFAVDGRGQQVGDQNISAFKLSPEAAQVASDINVAPLMVRLYDERVQNGKPTADTLAIRQEIMERVIAASLDIDSVNAVVDNEIEHVRAVRGRLQARRDKAQNLVNVASIFGGGVAGVVGTAMQFTARTANLGNAMRRRRRCGFGRALAHWPARTGRNERSGKFASHPVALRRIRTRGC